MALDVAIKDIPAATLSFASGQDIDTVLYNFGGALEADLVGNSIGEFVGIGFDAALSAVKSTIRESASEAVERSCKPAQNVQYDSGKEYSGNSLELVDDGIDVANSAELDVTDITNSKKRIDKITVEFNYTPQYDEAEFARQLANQQDGMNNLTVQEYIDNRKSYIENGRSRDANIAQKVAREKAFVSKVDELQDAGIPLREAEMQALEWLNTQAALHNPDQVAGGYPEKVTELGDGQINSSIGSQWRYRISKVDNQVKIAIECLPKNELESTYLDVELIYRRVQ